MENQTKLEMVAAQEKKQKVICESLSITKVKLTIAE